MITIREPLLPHRLDPHSNNTTHGNCVAFFGTAVHPESTIFRHCALPILRVVLVIMMTGSVILIAVIIIAVVVVVVVGVVIIIIEVTDEL